MTKAYIIVYNIKDIQSSYINNLVKSIKRSTRKPCYIVPHVSNIWNKPVYIIPVNVEK